MAAEEATSPAETTRAERLRSFLESHRQEYGRQVLWFLVTRVLIVLLCVVILLVYEEGAPSRFSSSYVLLVCALAVATVQLAASRVLQDFERLVLVAVCLDVIVASAVAYLTGGIYNIGFSFLYFAAILSAVLLVSDGAGYIIASLATVALASVALIYWLAANGSIAPPLLDPVFYREVVQEMRPGRVTANLIGMVFALHGVAFLGSRLPRRLSQAQVLYDEVVERMGEGVVAIDRRGRILIANSEARRLLNWAGARNLVGRRFEDVLRRKEDQRVLGLLTSGVDAHVELELDIRERDPRPVEVKTTVFHDRGAPERVRGVVGIFRDLSMRRRAEEAEARLSRLQDIEQMALGIAHEIRNPLGSIRGAVQELASQSFEDEGDQRLARIVRRESDRLDRILQEFLDFARMRPPISQPIDLRTLVEETVTLLSAHEGAAEVEIELEAGSSWTIRGDVDQLRQALLNIGVNALDALKGKGRIEVALHEGTLAQKTRSDGEGRSLAATPAVEVAISNDGPPIDPETARQMFTPFFTTKTQGLGLGLAITQKILKAHGGDISCTTGSLGGACFRLLLPLASAEQG